MYGMRKGLSGKGKSLTITMSKKWECNTCGEPCTTHGVVIPPGCPYLKHIISSTVELGPNWIAAKPERRSPDRAKGPAFERLPTKTHALFSVTDGGTMPEIRQIRKTLFCPHLDNVGGCSKTIGHKKCTCVEKGKTIKHNY
jgi:hypothetical protein